MSRNVRLSVIDLLWPGDMPELITELERLAYARYWATEHHGPEQSASPRLMAALGAGLTDSIRVGTGGIMLRAEAPLRVAEDFLLLELFFEGRIDLGVVSTLPPEPLSSDLLDGRSRPTREELEVRLKELIELLRTGKARGVRLGPSVESVPEFWLCGMNSDSARMAGRLGIGYAFHHQLSQQLSDAEDGVRVVSEYRRSFRPSPERSAPEVLVACYGMCAASLDEAAVLWRECFEHPEVAGSAGRTPTASFLGDPQTCHAELLLLADRYEVDELLIQCMCIDLTQRLDAYRRIAEVFSLTETPETRRQASGGL